ncbi:MAG TPA: DNA repair protein RecN [Bacteroidia bacterium]|nr:DNA repair protein RecN [Bacteroidia bacterium]
MLAQLKVQNFALIKDLNISFHPQMNIITGETGAGKSILLGALGLVLGDRADVKSLGNMDEKCVIEGTFDIKGYGLEEFFAENELDYDDTTIIRREITEAGKSRTFINDTPVQLTVLKELGNQLVSIHSQHETLGLNDRSFQLSVVDSFAGHFSLLKEYKEVYKQFRQAEIRLKELQADEEAAKRELDYATFLHTELSEASLSDNELEQLEKEQEMLSHAEEIRQGALNTYHILNESELPAIDLLNQAKTQLVGPGKNDERLAALAKRIDSALIDLKDVANELQTISDTVQADDERLFNINQRLQLIYNLLKKHQAANTTELLVIQAQLSEKLFAAGTRDEEIQKLTDTCIAFKEKLSETAACLSQNRMDQRRPIQDNIAQVLHQVGMPNAKMEVNVTPLAEGELNETGMDTINFLFSSNPGSPLQPLNKVASGGELSRLMLAIKSLVADNVKLPTLIFDEIDTGISGEVAAKTGRVMKQLAHNHQVISVTHLPQIAGTGHRHFFVYKEVLGNSTETRIKQLAEAERVEEIAKMISGETPSESARANARELLMMN